MKISQILMTLTLVLGSGVLGFGQLAYAQHHEMDGKPMQHRGMQEADANKDGVISHDEFTEAHKVRSEKMFEKMDANHDGKLDEAERKAGKAKMGEFCKMKDGAK